MSGEYREGVERDLDIFPFDEGNIVSMGIDPGATYTGVCVTRGEIPIHAETITRAKGEDYMPYAMRVANRVEEIYNQYVPDNLGVEMLTMPKGFSRSSSKASPINPGHLVMAGVVLGSVAQRMRGIITAYIHPKGNGSRHKSWYYPSLLGRRPKDLPGDSNGAGRGHEQSAYDVALKSAQEKWPIP